jgi:uncharacterized phage protein (TIGR01671 family)
LEGEEEMSREIKFRAWNGSKMEYNVMAGFLGAFYVQGIDEKDSACMSPFNTKCYSETPIMQYTEKKDKNGKEIYDKDILKTKYDDKLMAVEWNERFSSFCLKRKDWAFCHFFGEAVESEECEIIGNIYQNPKLLK